MDDVHEEAFGEGEGFADEASHAPAQGGVEAFLVVGVLLLGLLMQLVGWDGVGISLQAIGETTAVFVVRGHLGPHILRGESVALAPHPRHDLARAAAQHEPQPNAVLLVAHKRPHLIQLQDIVLLRRQQCLRQGPLGRLAPA